MESCDVLVVGGGPAGSTCASHLTAAGLDVVVMDRAAFPRDKVCAGWITPQVVRDLRLDLESYRQTRTLQPITGFRLGLMSAGSTVCVTYDRPVSYGIRRCEFDDYLLRRSSARLMLETALRTLVWDRHRRTWIVNETLRAPMVVGAGGHLCPVAARLNGCSRSGALVVAQEAEFLTDASGVPRTSVEAALPELFFCPDLLGYGWCFKKGRYLNVGLGRVGDRGLAQAARAFSSLLEGRGALEGGSSPHWRGHSYLLSTPAVRQVVGDGILLIGDAAGLAYSQSGEGIRPAVESGILAAETIREAGWPYTRERLTVYGQRLAQRFRHHAGDTVHPTRGIGRRSTAATALLMRVPLVARWWLDRSFLRASEPSLRDGGQEGLF